MLSVEDFKATVRNTPLVSLDLIIKNNKGEVLVGKRINSPAKNYWFVPGGRIFKNESIEKALSRIMNEEVGMLFSKKECKSLGVYEHFYQDSFYSKEVSTHYIVLAFEIKMDKEIAELPKKQHSEYRLIDINELLTNEQVHQNTKMYFETKSILNTN
ncbi:GDP-mannose mannosyl hydrolase [Aliikangiella marina]|uniref:GDP-mannose mannosyl hydrolase n=1 Tax=Aliikangiella marina TaxID=1712262 RepID=A0A545TII9_9GAMM|nr:GDP-mannose mannosyl hydrolase [Aliikangiella marina]TQV77035.1 GDP-mannose mannosyl hydrolase [Aliikangiella marina]